MLRLLTGEVKKRRSRRAMVGYRIPHVPRRAAGQLRQDGRVCRHELGGNDLVAMRADLAADELGVEEQCIERLLQQANRRPRAVIDPNQAIAPGLHPRLLE